jgi:hypothetical protein
VWRPISSRWIVGGSLILTSCATAPPPQYHKADGVPATDADRARFAAAKVECNGENVEFQATARFSLATFRPRASHAPATRRVLPSLRVYLCRLRGSADVDVLGTSNALRATVELARILMPVT